ncbi:MAG: leucine-rich repeat domain-containing protein [Clostridia bacterium]|nr:leucine-rich repeat domain-containing protein [Clostridia bacterium]
MICAFPCSVAFATDSFSGTCGQNATFTINPDTGVTVVSGKGEVEVNEIADLKSFCEATIFEAEPSLRNNIKYIYNGKLITDLVVPEGTKSIGEGTFAYNQYVTSVTLPKNTETYVSPDAFTGCKNLKQVTFQNPYSFADDESF